MIAISKYNKQHPLRVFEAFKPIFPEQKERKFIENFNNSQPLAKNKVVKCHIMRN